MLEDYKQIQPIAYQTIKNSIHNKRISHAYLIDTNDYKDYKNFTLALASTLICEDKDCNNCNICERIKNGNYPELFIIEPEGLMIKKEQLKTLQEEFKTKGIEGNKRIYIIFEADKLNASASNSILKFLEEPEEGIIAILVTNNSYNIIDTITSRCQVIKLKKQYSDSETALEYFFGSDKDNDKNYVFICNCIEFIKFYEKRRVETLLFTNELIKTKVKTKEEMDKFFEILICFYKDILNVKLANKPYIFKEDIDELLKIADMNNVNNLIRKIRAIINLKQRIKNNVNLDLLTDKLIIELEGGK